MPVTDYELKIETDEDGFYLVIGAPNFDGELELVRYRIANPEEFYNSVKSEIGPWLHERDRARAEGWDRLDASNLWPGPITDPKHPDHHNVMSEVSDTREIG